MRHILLGFCGLIFYLFFAPIYVKEARRQRQSGNDGLAWRYIAIIVVLAIPMVIVPLLPEVSSLLKRLYEI